MCHFCLVEEKEVVVLKIKNRHYGSLFDGDNTEILLCNNCVNDLEVDVKWFDNDIITKQDDDGFTTYLDEQYIVGLINVLPIQSQEKILNKPNAHFEKTMDSNEWIELHENGYF